MSIICGNNSLKILTWNVNGIRTMSNLKETLDSLGADIICFQETKITRDLIDEGTALLQGYNSYFSFSRVRSGYSGVATYCKNGSLPLKAEEGLSGILATGEDTIGCYGAIPAEFSPQELKQLDSEGRALITQHQVEDSSGTHHLVHIINVYCPFANPDRSGRLDFKLKFYQLLEMRAAALRQFGHVIILGDLNTNHRQIDRCEQLPEDVFENNPGRQWLNRIITDTHNDEDDVNTGSGIRLIDSFRHFHPLQRDAYTCWNVERGARSTNYGSRIDYILTNKKLIENMADSVILSSVMGSDHCPVIGYFNLKIIPAVKIPSLCTKYYPEFSGTQSKLTSFLTNKTSFNENPPEKKPKLSLDGNSKNKRSTQMNILSFCQKDPAAVLTTTEIKEPKASLSQEKFVESSTVGQSSSTKESAAAWRALLKGPQPAPLCRGHNEPCVERIVKKKGPNQNRRFWACARGEGRADDPNARCDFFQWAKKM